MTDKDNKKDNKTGKIIPYFYYILIFIAIIYLLIIIMKPSENVYDTTKYFHDISDVLTISIDLYAKDELIHLL